MSQTILKTPSDVSRLIEMLQPTPTQDLRESYKKIFIAKPMTVRMFCTRYFVRGISPAN